MASMLVEDAQWATTVEDMEMLHDRIAGAVGRLNGRRAGNSVFAAVHVSPVLRHPEKKNHSFVVTYSDADKRAPKVVKKVLRQQRRSLLRRSAGITAPILLDWFGLGYHPA